MGAKYTKVPVDTLHKTAPYMFARDLALDVAGLADQQNYHQQNYLAQQGRIKKPVPIGQLIDARYVVTMRERAASNVH